MLDFNKIAKTIPTISKHFSTESAASLQKLEKAQNYLKKCANHQQEVINKYLIWKQRLIFNAATPMESLDTRKPINTTPYSHTVLGTDGSQITPSHHEIAYCYLINVGRVLLHYGQSKHPLLDSIPEVFYKQEDLAISRQWGIRIDEWLGYMRTASEATFLADLASEWLNNNPSSPVPSLAMVDGSLIYWFLDTLPSEARDRILSPILSAWDKLRALNIPLMGYISATRNNDSINLLRFLTCIHPVPDCITYCVNSDRPPCQVFDPIRDSALWGMELKPGERSCLFKSTNRILDLYPDNEIYFCYVNVGSEIARIEIPIWVAENQEMFEQSLSLMLAQVQKGYGYPVVLAEAHNQAVIRSGDRAQFFALLEQEMIKVGLRNVGISYKETRKRGSIA
jgi:NurA domain